MASSKKNLTKWHFLGFIFVFISMTIFVFYQLFVDKNYRRINPIVFFQPKTLKTAIEKLIIRPADPDISQIFYIENNVLYQNPIKPQLIVRLEQEIQDNQIFLSPNKDKLAFLTKDNQLVIIKNGKKHLVKSFPKDSDIQIIHWHQNNEDLLIAQKEDFWSISKMQNNEIIKLKDNINFSHYPLTKTFSFIREKIVYPTCQEICELEILDVKNGSVEKIPAIVDHNPNDRIRDLLFAFYDETEKLIAYQRVPGDKELNFYVINFNKELIQVVQLAPNQTKRISFIGYCPQTQEMLFVSQDLQEKFQELFLYAANRPSLKFLGKIGQDQGMRVINNDFYIIIDRYLRNIFDQKFSLEIDNKKITSVF